MLLVSPARSLLLRIPLGTNRNIARLLRIPPRLMHHHKAMQQAQLLPRHSVVIFTSRRLHQKLWGSPKSGAWLPQSQLVRQVINSIDDNAHTFLYTPYFHL